MEQITGSAKISRFACRYGKIFTGLSLAIPAIGILTRPVEVIGGQKSSNDEDELILAMRRNYHFIGNAITLSSYL